MKVLELNSLLNGVAESHPEKQNKISRKVDINSQKGYRKHNHKKDRCVVRLLTVFS
jgi:hypothetical protein